MGWNDRTKPNFEEIFGMKEEDIKTTLAEAKTLKEKNTALENTVSTQTTELQTVKAGLAALEERIKQTPNNNNEENNGNRNVQIPSVTDDEDAAFATRLAPMYEQNLLTNYRITKNEVFSSLRASDPFFSKLEADVTKLLEANPLAMRGGPQAEQVIRNAYFVVKGQKADQIANDIRAGKGEFFIESARNGNSSMNNMNENQTDPNKLSPEEEALIARMGVSKDTYLKTRNSGVNMSGGLRYA